MKRTAVFATVCTLLLAYGQAQAGGEQDVVEVPIPHRSHLDPQPRIADTGDLARLELCDCQPASGAPGGLSCDKEGFFVSSFERQGQWMAGGGAVPLSRAICCRPCLPASLPNTSTAAPLARALADHSDTPLAVVSLGCHASNDPLGVRCEADAASFISGFADSVRVFASADTQYPINTAQCCTPALLMASGDAWALQRCGCGVSEDRSHPVSCGGGQIPNATQLLAGFDFFRLSPLAQVVPVGPAKCCSVCVSGKVHPAAACAELDGCSGNGVCLLGRCECSAGWGGPDCSQPLGGKTKWGGRIPPWAVALIVIGSCLLAMAILSTAAHLAELIFEARTGGSDGDGDSPNRPLLLRIDADDAGSVGSQDTEECDEGVEERIEGVILSLEDANERAAAAAAAAENAGGDEEEVSTGPAMAPSDRGVAATGDADEELRPAEESGGELEAAVAADLSTVETGGGAASAAADAAAAAAPPAEAEEKLGGAYAGVGPLGGVDCVVCMIRPVQTVVVPCGHVCMCRRCARRLTRCPICRKEVARRQRLYI